MQAEPTEQAIPSRSSDERHRRAVRVAGDHRERGPAGARFGCPVSSVPATARTAFDRRSRRRRSRADRRRSLGTRQLVGRRQPDRARDVLGAGPAMALLRAALLLGEDVRPVADVQRADALGALELVGPERHEVGPERRRRRGRCRARPGPRRRGAARPCGPWTRRGDLGDRLDRADLVVGEHDRDQDRPVGERGLELVGIDPAVAVDRQLDDLEPELLEVAQRVTDRVVLDRRGDDAVAAGLARPGGALEREVVGLGAARGEDDLARLGVQALGQSFVGLVERRARDAPVRVRRAGVPERLGQERQHRVEDLATQRRRGRVIEVDRHRADRTPLGGWRPPRRRPPAWRPRQAGARRSSSSLPPRRASPAITMPAAIPRIRATIGVRDPRGNEL